MRVADKVMPNPSLKLTRYGMRCKPGLRPLRHHRSPGLHRMPPRQLSSNVRRHTYAIEDCCGPE